MIKLVRQLLDITIDKIIRFPLLSQRSHGSAPPLSQHLDDMFPGGGATLGP